MSRTHDKPPRGNEHEGRNPSHLLASGGKKAADNHCRAAEERGCPVAGRRPDEENQTEQKEKSGQQILAVRRLTDRFHTKRVPREKQSAGQCGKVGSHRTSSHQTQRREKEQRARRGMKQGAGQTETEGIFAPDRRIHHQAGKLHGAIAVDFVQGKNAQGNDIRKIRRLVDVIVEPDLQNRIVDQLSSEAGEIKHKCRGSHEQRPAPRRVLRAEYPR